jgi:uncharacterized coiled-coil protein SlyX
MSTRISLLRQKFHVLLHNIGISDSKEAILAGYGALSTTELTEDQLTELVDRLQKMDTNKREAPKTIRAERSIILNLLTMLGVYIDSGSWTAVNVYLLDKRIAGKMLYEMSELELQRLQVKLRAILKKRKEDESANYHQDTVQDN